MTVSLNRRFSQWVGARVSYTYAKALDNTGNAFFFTPQDNSNLKDDRGRSDNDRRHRLTLSVTLAAPETKGDSTWRRVVEGFQFSYIFSYGSPLPFNIQTGSDRNFDTSVNDRPVSCQTIFSDRDEAAAGLWAGYRQCRSEATSVRIEIVAVAPFASSRFFASLRERSFAQFYFAQSRKVPQRR